MIEIVKTGPCKDCDLAELYLDTIHVDGFYESHELYSIHCRHEKVCEGYRKILESERKGRERDAGVRNS